MPSAMWNGPNRVESDGGELADDETETLEDEEMSTVDAEERGTFAESGRRGNPSAIVRRPDFLRYGRVVGGKYFVDHVLGRSGRDIVVHARHLELGQRVVLRSLRSEACSSTEAVAQFVRGARAVLQLQSERVERIIDLGRLESGAPYRVTELPRGPSLAEVVRVRGALPVSEAVDYIVLASEGVAEAHAIGIVHRNLSTTSLVLERRADGPPSVRLLDVGVSDPLEPIGIDDSFGLFDVTAVPASLQYASPEQIRAPENVDGRADVWALGAVLYELLTGTPVFQSDAPRTLLAMITADAPVPLRLFRHDIPPELEATILRCLEKDREVRFQSVAEFALAVLPFASDATFGSSARIERLASRSKRPMTMTVPPASRETLPGMGQYPSNIRIPNGAERAQEARPNGSDEPRIVPPPPVSTKPRSYPPPAPPPSRQPSIPTASYPNPMPVAYQPSAPPPTFQPPIATPPPAPVRTSFPPPLPSVAKSSAAPRASVASSQRPSYSIPLQEQPDGPFSPRTLVAGAAVLGIAAALGVYGVTHAARPAPRAAATIAAKVAPAMPSPPPVSQTAPAVTGHAVASPAPTSAPPAALAAPIARPSTVPAAVRTAEPSRAPALPAAARAPEATHTPATAITAPTRNTPAAAPRPVRERDDSESRPDKTAASRETAEKKPPAADDLFGGMW